MTHPHPTLPEAISAALDARQAAAEAATEASSGGDSWFVDGPAAVSGKYWVYATGEKFGRRELAAHIAANDPASTLRRVAADRKLLALHRSCTVRPSNAEICESGKYLRACDTLLALAEGLGLGLES